jgi:hypothetical protein
MLDRCSCGHLPIEHVIAVDSGGPGVYGCLVSMGRGTCACSLYTRPLADPEIDEDLPWAAGAA